MRPGGMMRGRADVVLVAVGNKKSHPDYHLEGSCAFSEISCLPGHCPSANRKDATRSLVSKVWKEPPNFRQKFSQHRIHEVAPDS